jgi:hypothetical protein
MNKKAEHRHVTPARYVRCLNNKRFIFFKDEPRVDEELVRLIVGKVYKLAPPEANDGDLLRVIDESGEDYLYPATYFEPLSISDEHGMEAVTAHVPAWLKDVLYAEAVANNKSISALVRDFIEEQLDLPA